MRFQYAIFDMDGLMFDTERLFVESFKMAVEPATGQEFAVDKLKLLLGCNKKTTAELFPQLFGTEVSCEECYAIGDRWVEEYIAEHGIPLKPGIEELLIWLKENGFQCVVATATNREKAWNYIQSVKLDRYFDGIIGGDMVTRGKPDPQTFLMAAELLGCQDVSQCVVFEDSKNGLLAGHNANMAVIVVPDLLDPTEMHPGICYAKVKNLSDAIPILEKANQEA